MFERAAAAVASLLSVCVSTHEPPNSTNVRPLFSLPLFSPSLSPTLFPFSRSECGLAAPLAGQPTLPPAPAIRSHTLTQTPKHLKPPSSIPSSSSHRGPNSTIHNRTALAIVLPSQFSCRTTSTLIHTTDPVSFRRDLNDFAFGEDTITTITASEVTPFEAVTVTIMPARKNVPNKPSGPAGGSSSGSRQTAPAGGSGRGGKQAGGSSSSSRQAMPAGGKATPSNKSNSPPRRQATAGPSSGAGASSAVERLKSGEMLLDYRGDMQSMVTELVWRIEDDETSRPDDAQRQELVAALAAYVEQAAAAGALPDEMRALLEEADALFEEYAITRAGEKGSAYKKLSNLFTVKKTQRDRQQKRQTRK
ncbi:hypothetical protein PCL_13015 [Purpureocillium lilacinum]|uniref:Uncharacterized protein n=3 Tax=Purpureocillium lilacinum TaxID=33203 RepID=A0A2U3E803_PURLI|nr:hypothetical protein PCL_13015 [Purpureocillium lilacinum]